MASELDATRRQFIFGIGAMGLSLVLNGSGSSVNAEEASSTTTSPEVTAWVAIQTDDTIMIRIARSDMGQGILTSLPMLVAEELECDWSQVRTEFVSASENVKGNHRWGPMVTTNSISVRSSQAFLRKAGAQARSMLIAEAAARWNVPIEECTARDSIITHHPTQRRARFAEVAAGASRRPVPENVPLKDPDAWRLIGTSAKRLEAPAKVIGEPIYASDVSVPNMLHAAVLACPAYGGKLKSFRADKVMSMPGVRHVVPIGEDAVSVVATSWWQAKKALDVLPVTWDETASGDLSTDSLRRMFRDGLDAADAATGEKIGDTEAAFGRATKVIESEYEVPYLAHVTMEPQTCTAHVLPGHAEVWAPTQNAEGTLAVVSHLLNLNPSQVTIHACQLGGGFGRRGLAQDWAIQSVQIAKAVGHPVKMTWSREQDIARDYYRPMVFARQKAGFDAQGKLIAWRVRLSGSSIFQILAPQFMRNGVDFVMMDGFLTRGLDYAAPPNYDVAFSMRQTAIPVGFWRAVNLSQNTYFREVFVDEMAEACGQEPYQFRREMLASNPRALEVLDEAAKRADWGHAPSGRHQGMALIQENGSLCAQVVELSVDLNRIIKVHRIVCVVDPNFVVHPDISIAQMEGGIIQGLAATLTGEVTLDRGRVQQTNFNDYMITRMNETPSIDVHLMPSLGRFSREWGGIGETGLPAVAPAIVNAIYAATGRRVRSLPLKNHGLIAT
jgi:isoquinoline 1-oxidoreductase subunit beta